MVFPIVLSHPKFHQLKLDDNLAHYESKHWRLRRRENGPHLQGERDVFRQGMTSSTLVPLLWAIQTTFSEISRKIGGARAPRQRDLDMALVGRQRGISPAPSSHRVCQPELLTTLSLLRSLDSIESLV